MQRTYTETINMTNKQFIRSNERQFKAHKLSIIWYQTHQNTNGIQRPQNGPINVDQNSTRISQTRPKSS